MAATEATLQADFDAVLQVLPAASLYDKDQEDREVSIPTSIHPCNHVMRHCFDGTNRFNRSPSGPVPQLSREWIREWQMCESDLSMTDTRLGKGSFCHVLKALFRDGQFHVAVKAIHDDASEKQHEFMLDDLRSEMLIASRLPR
jgi:hypothetical protein